VTAGAAAVQAADTVPAAAVRTTGLSKRYGKVLALDHLDLEVPTGVVFGLLGPNGAGKTTAIRLLTGLAHPTAGTATVTGVRIDDRNGAALRRRIGYLDQDPRFYGWMRGRELLELVGRLHGLDGPALRERVGETLERVGLAEAGERQIGGYSGGMRQRLGIGQAIVNRPELLILDEPVSSLDPEGRRDLLALIAALRGTSTVVFSTHVLTDVERVCDRIAILDHGRLVREGPLVDLLDEYAGPVYVLDPEPGQDPVRVEGLVTGLRTAPWASDVTLEHGFVRVVVSDPETAGRAILERVVASGVALAGFQRSRPTLEDVFLRLTGTRDASGEETA
jgi:ABC-2 type transport system ATP-binding protein